MSTTTAQPIVTPHVETSRWRIDPDRSSVEFRARTFWGLMTVKGRFERYDGTLDLRDGSPIELTIDANSVDTGNESRDKHLRSSDFFDVEKHAQVRFVSDGAEVDGERLNVSGRLYAAGESTPLELDATVREVGDELELEARTQTDHRGLGMSGGMLGMIRAPSELIVHGRLIRDPD
jgi:polyisoprenoid-binding protein YceI